MACDICDNYYLNRSKMRTRENQTQAERICQFFENNARDRSLTYSHFKLENIHRSTICGILNRYERSGTAEYSKKRGSKASCTDDKMVRKVRKLFRDIP